jgi:EAL domain-containing protein (putative c-di-GMP-specific phosphodiesterase class I)
VAVRTAIDADIAAPVALFINIEPSALRTKALDDLVEMAASAPRPLQIVLEITERELAARPAELLAAVMRLRKAGWRIALDDVGAVDMSLTFLCLLNPDVVKIDMGIVQRRPDAATAALMNALNAYVERTGAVLLAEGVEDEVHLAAAFALGARLGQGWMFGRPTQTPVNDRPAGALTLPPPVPTDTPRSPFHGLPARADLRVSTKALLIEISKHLERHAVQIGTSALVLSTFQQNRYFTGPTRERYRRLAENIGFVGVFAQGMARDPVDGIRGQGLDSDDPVCHEWDIIVLSPHFSAALIARDRTSGVATTPERDRQFEFVLTYDRATVTAAAHSLMVRIPAT